MTARSTHLVLVPGLACTEDLFAEQIASLRGEIAISVADHTRHDTMGAIARAVLATAPHRLALCGLSMGGYDRIERLALLDTSALSDTPEQTKRRLAWLANPDAGCHLALKSAYGKRARPQRTNCPLLRLGRPLVGQRFPEPSV
jgi:pimeloyl-ACP methyl ester carboxylesterase